METLRQSMNVLRSEMGLVLSSTLFRLIVAAVLGGVIGVERQLRRKPAGLRTNMFICFGAAMFTVLSGELAGKMGGDHTRVAAQIIPGIGFIGAGSILHARGSVTGLTTAATLFVVASVGMAAGGGLYVTAVFATVVILVALAVLGKLERRYELKSQLMTYEVRGASATVVFRELARILEREQKAMQDVRVAGEDDTVRVDFCVEGSPAEHNELNIVLRQSNVFTTVSALGCQEHE